MARSLRLSGNQFHIAGPATEKSAPTVTAETIARHDEKTLVGRAKVLSVFTFGSTARAVQSRGCSLFLPNVHHASY